MRTRSALEGGVEELKEVTQEQAGEIALEVKGLKKSYGFKPTLRAVNLTAYRGERLALLGANGAGKTTLLRLLAGLMRPGKGTIRIEGLEMERDAQRIRQLIGFVAHQPYLYEELTANENLLFFGQMYGVAQLRERAQALLERVGLTKRIHERVSTLSRGQLQRLAWARALLHEPRLLLLDEPDTGLDQEGHALVEALLNEHRQGGGTTLFTSHQLEYVLRFSDNVALLSGGRIVTQMPTATLTLEKLQQIYQEKVR
ncbi:heme ABC exporter ATP-binding protein CcmA [Ktedonosporobacter rubrisoli]|uniref:Heme ABC exporter ATP-binding protein CcmA n=1 Tax=Ktedonosporobacter rubrisoli TaxID=2509675 RepID=A0A4P6JZP4_KTERU|nr:heme ABC exporter ATP-binding protein CcmA [Ktedonosporobacter rubrisoli]QBD81224.1 heme ABC exporter ATP-binding protein CcmA [Ktedonosporobacter rubrisoli]